MRDKKWRNVVCYVQLLLILQFQVKIWFQNRRMKWRNSKERELLSGGGSRDATLPSKSNPGNDEDDVINKDGRIACKQSECTQTKTTDNINKTTLTQHTNDFHDVEFDSEQPMDDVDTSSSDSEGEIDVS